MRPTHLTMAILLLPACGASPEVGDTTLDTPDAMVIVEPSDAPWITILEPTSMQVYEAVAATLTVSGEADETTMAVRWTNDETGSSGETNGTTAWGMILALERGLQRYTFTASDTTIPFTLSTDLPDGAYLTFMAGTSYWEVHHVLIDNVRLYEGDCGA